MFINAHFETLCDKDSGRIFENMEFENCIFDNCYFSSTLNIEKRSIARNLEFKKCTSINSVIDCGIVEDTIIENLKTKNILQFWGTVFSRVVLKGNIDKIMISPLLATATAPKEIQLIFDKKNAQYYQNVEWALDISQANFLECDIRGLSTKLIIRDKETQLVLLKNKIQNINWNEFDLINQTYFSIISNLMLKKDYDEILIVAPKRDKKFKSLLSDFGKLQKAGILE